MVLSPEDKAPPEVVTAVADRSYRCGRSEKDAGKQAALLLGYEFNQWGLPTSR
jgi:hypothetical protein